MAPILILDPLVANKIAAGEVVERPSAVVKELVENAIDANSTRIYVEIQNGGKKLIRITDNGSGISPNEMQLAFERHATSKVSTIEDIYALTTLGFRGEALASIAAVSHVEMTSKQRDNEVGQHIKLSGGKVVEQTGAGTQDGTTIVIKDLFYNTPARMKFMKSTGAETGAISDLMIRLALSHSEVGFTYVVDGKNIFKTSGDGDAYKVIYSVLDKELAQNMLPVSFEEKGWKLTGYISKLSYTRGNRSQQIFFVNQRYIKSRMMLDAVSGAYLGQLPIGRFPGAILSLEIPTDQVDVNIHPAKTEVKFHNEMALKDWMLLGLRKAIRSLDQIPEIASFKYKSEAPRAEIKPEIRPEIAHNGQELYKAQIGAQAPKPYKAENQHTDQVSTEISKPVEMPMAKPTITAVVKPTATPMVKPTGEFDVSLLAHLKMEDMVKEKVEPLVVAQTTFIKTSEGLYDDLQYIGQVFNSYLLFQKMGQLYVIDQHAGHEKILYEQFRKSFSNEKIVTQVLAKPILLAFNHSEWVHLMELAPKMAETGFVYEAFGEQEIVVREVPLVFHAPATEAFFKDLIDVLGRTSLSASEIWKDRLIKSACKAAIKANDTMEAFEVKKLVDDLKGLEDPYTCPHGRPIIVTITQLEFEKMFKRT